MYLCKGEWRASTEDGRPLGDSAGMEAGSPGDGRPTHTHTTHQDCISPRPDPMTHRPGSQRRSPEGMQLQGGGRD